MRKESKKILIYGSVYFVLLAAFVFGFRGLFDMEQSVGVEIAQAGSGSLGEAIEIICNNMKNFIGYILIYPIYPLMYGKDLIFTSWTVSVSFSVRGVRDTFCLLIPHAVIEMPNFILFTYLSFSNFKAFWKEKNVTGKAYAGRIWRYRHWYIICFVMLLLAGLVEGVMTKVIYGLFVS